MEINSINIDSANMTAAKTDAANITRTSEHNIQNKNTIGTSNSSRELRMLKDEIEEANHILQMSDRRCQFQCVEGTSRIAIKVIDTNTDEVVREIPSEETIEMIKKLQEMTGFLIDQRS